MGIVDDIERRTTPREGSEGHERDVYTFDYRRLISVARAVEAFGTAHEAAHVDLTESAIERRRDALRALTRIGNALATNDLAALDAALASKETDQ